jgi:hypothetical protein
VGWRRGGFLLAVGFASRGQDGLGIVNNPVSFVVFFGFFGEPILQSLFVA